LPRAALGKEPSRNFESANRFLPRALYRAHGKAFAEAKKKTSAKCKSKKPEKNSKIILFFLKTPTSHHPHPRDFL
jgi:hypothetical protein